MLPYVYMLKHVMHNMSFKYEYIYHMHHDSNTHMIYLCMYICYGRAGFREKAAQIAAMNVDF